MRLPSAFLVASLVAGCGLEQGGGQETLIDLPDASLVDGDVTASDAAAPPDGAPLADGAVPVDAAPPVDATPGCDAGTASPGLVIVPRSGPCPTGTMETVQYQNPSPQPDACTCSACQVQAEPSCAGNLKLAWGAASACGAGSASYSNVGDNVCTNFGYGIFTLANYHYWGARTPTAGACTSTPTANPTKLDMTSVRVCTAPTPAAVCAAVASNERRCIPSAGACGGAYPVPMVVGDGAQVTCGGCGCARTATSCVVDYYKDAACTQAGGYSALENGVCTATNNATGIGWFKAHPSQATCAVAPAQAGATLVGAKSLCCTP